MDKLQQKLQSLSVVTIFKESIKVILKNPRLFTYIALAFIIPFGCFSQPDLYNFFFASNTATTTTTNITTNITTIVNNTTSLSSLNNNNDPTNTQTITSPTDNNIDLGYYLSLKFIIPLLINLFLRFTVELIFSLLYTAAIIYTVTCIYTSKEITFKKVLNVLPKVWKRLLITLLSTATVIVAYSAIFIVIIMVMAIFAGLFSVFIMVNTSYRPGENAKTVMGMVMGFMMWFVINGGWLCMEMFWQLGNVISVLEDFRGFQAMKRSMKLIKGNKKTAAALVFVPFACFESLGFLRNKIVGNDAENAVKFWVAIVSVVINSMLNLYVVVLETMFYFECKSYHHEDIDKSKLDDRLEDFVGEYGLLEEGHINHND